MIPNYLSSSHARRVQSVEKSTHFINSLIFGAPLQAGDDLRFAYVEFVLHDPAALLLPHGLGARGYYGNVDPTLVGYHDQANTADSGLLYVLFHGGFVVTVVLLIGLARRLRQRLTSVRMLDAMYVAAGVIVFATYLITVGDVFVVLQRGATAGMFIGVLGNRRM